MSPEPWPRTLANSSAAQNLGVTLAYSSADQLMSRVSSNGLYDWNSQSVGVTNATADGLNRDAAIAALPNGYSANGNETADGVRTFIYDREDRLTSATVTASQTIVNTVTGATLPTPAHRVDPR